MALPHPRQPACRRSPILKRLQEHRMPRRRARLRRQSSRSATRTAVPHSRWDGKTTKTHPVTGEQVPDESARQPLLRYINPRRAEWPQADYIVGNPPFIGAATHARRPRRRLRRSPARDLAERARVRRLRHVLVAPRRRNWSRRPGPALRLHHHQQPQPDLQPPRRAERRSTAASTSPSPSPITRGSTAPTAPPCALP